MFLLKKIALTPSLLALGLGCAVPAAAQVLVPATPAPSANAAPAAASGEAGTGEGRSIRAQLSPRRYTTIAAEIGAKVNRLPVPEGGSFAAGDIILAFDCAIQEAQLKKAEAALSGSESTWQANERLRELNAIGKVELDVSRAEFEKNKAEVTSMSTVLSKCNVAAPFAGRVAEQKVREQQYVQPGQVLLDILDDSVLELEFLVPSRWLAWLKVGHSFRVRIDETGKSYPAKIQRIGARVDPVSQSIKVQAAIDGKFPELLAGMSGRASLSSR